MNNMANRFSPFNLIIERGLLGKKIIAYVFRKRNIWR